MTGLRTLFRRDVTGAAAVEFAVCGAVLLTLIIGTFEACVAAWLWQALETTAANTARCAGVNATACANVTASPINTQTFAVSIARGLGLGGLATSNVTVMTGANAQTACGTTATVVSVSVSYPNLTAVVVPLPSMLSASACFPLDH